MNITGLEKSLVLIDAENVWNSWRNYCNKHNLDEKVDYVKLVDTLTKDTNKLRAIFYDAVPETIPKSKKEFIKAMENNNIQVNTKILKHRKVICSKCNAEIEKYVQKGVDIAIATDLLRHSFLKNCQICILVSGDEDYKDAVSVSKDMGMKVWIASFKDALSSDLRKVADKVIYLDDLFDSIKRQ